MFERFTDDSRQAVVVASEVARERGDHSIEALHLLIGLADEPALVRTRLSRHRIEALWDEVIAAGGKTDGIDAEALAGIGIDADAVRDATDHHFGRGALGRARRHQTRPSTGHLPFSVTLKDALGRSLTHAANTRSRDLVPTHLLLGLLDVDDPELLAVLAAASVSIDALRSAAVGSIDAESVPAQVPAAVRTGFDHVAVQVADLEVAAAFYEKTLAPLGITPLVRADDVAGFGADRPFFWLGRATTDGSVRELHLAFVAPDRNAVYAFRDAAVQAGAEILNEPRVFRGYHPSYFAAFVRDPDGNNVEAVCHAPTPG